MEQTVIYGVNPVMEALLRRTEVDTLCLAVGLRKTLRRDLERLAAELGISVRLVQRRELDRMAGGGVHQGVVALARRKPFASLEELVAVERRPRTLVLCLDGLQDPRNLGALARTADAFGAAGMVIPEHRSVGVTPAALKSSAGALARLPVCRVKNLSRALEELKEAGFWISGAVIGEGSAPWEIDPGERVVLVLGSEGSGLRSGVEQRLDHRIHLPQRGGSESLNVSVAGALILYEWLVRLQSG